MANWSNELEKFVELNDKFRSLLNDDVGNDEYVLLLLTNALPQSESVRMVNKSVKRILQCANLNVKSTQAVTLLTDLRSIMHAYRNRFTPDVRTKLDGLLLTLIDKLGG